MTKVDCTPRVGAHDRQILPMMRTTVINTAWDTCLLDHPRSRAKLALSPIEIGTSLQTGLDASWAGLGHIGTDRAVSHPDEKRGTTTQIPNFNIQQSCRN